MTEQGVTAHGIGWDTGQAPDFPAGFATSVAMRFVCVDPADARPRTIELQFLQANGEPVTAPAEITIQPPQVFIDGLPTAANLAVRVENVPIQGPGVYRG